MHVSVHMHVFYSCFFIFVEKKKFKSLHILLFVLFWLLLLVFFFCVKQIANSDATYGKSDKVMGQKRIVNRKLNQGMANPTLRMYAHTYTLTRSMCMRV